MSDTPITADAVNAYEGDDDNTIVVALRIDDEWLDVRLSHTNATTLADMLRLLTKTTD